MATFVLIHGGWDGGWVWGPVAHILRTAGHAVHTPTLTGSGERVHLASAAVGLDTHIQDVVNVCVYEDLSNVILVGHSYGGMVATGVAEQIPERLRRLVYLDGFAPEDGQSVADLAGPDLMAGMEQLAQALGDGWRIPHLPPGANRHTPFLLRAAQQPLAVNNSQAAQLPHTYVHFTSKESGDYTGPLMDRIAARVRRDGWDYHTLPFGHFPLLDQPVAVAGKLIKLA